MLTFDEARALLLRAACPLPAETIATKLAHGRVLARELQAPAAIPPFAYSAMDGFALAVADLPASGPWELPVAGESRTGYPSSALEPGKAARISTGAELPAGADAVVPRELTAATDAGIRVTELPRRGQHIRRAGEDLALGAVAIARGARLGPAHLGLALSLDQTELEVTRRPRVAILATGDELRAAGSPAGPGKIPDSVSLPLSVLAERAGASARVLPHVGDERTATERAIADGLRDTDLLLTVGGVSVGDHDWVRPALAAQGIELEFWKVAIKPGKPLAFGRKHASGPAVLGLPGNPASALVTFALFGMPYLRALQGDARPLPRSSRLPLARAFEHKPGRLEFVRATVEPGAGTTLVRPLENQASGALTSLAWADALAVIPAEAARVEAGSLIEVFLLDEI
ncbi:MAG TPA: gephyrin-like molybdotransferase Glp [Polyangiaceae bacterium]